MAMQAHRGGEVEAAGSRAWDRFFRIFFATTPHIVMRGMRKVTRRIPIEELAVIGRRTGRERRHQLTLLQIDGNLYVGHPNGRSQWAKNLEAGGGGVLLQRGSAPLPVRAVLLAPGAERSAAIAAAG